MLIDWLSDRLLPAADRKVGYRIQVFVIHVLQKSRLAFRYGGWCLPRLFQ